MATHLFPAGYEILFSNSRRGSNVTPSSFAILKDNKQWDYVHVHLRPIHATNMSMMFSTHATCQIQLKTLLCSTKSKSVCTWYSSESYKRTKEKSLSVLTMPAAMHNRSMQSSSKS